MTPEQLAERGIKIKPLAFKPRSGFTSDSVARTAWGQYSIGCIQGEWMWFFEYVFDCNSKTAKGRAGSEARAMNAANRDHISRVCAMLEVV